MSSGSAIIKLFNLFFLKIEGKGTVKKGSPERGLTLWTRLSAVLSAQNSNGWIMLTSSRHFIVIILYFNILDIILIHWIKFITSCLIYGVLNGVHKHSAFLKLGRVDLADVAFVSLVVSLYTSCVKPG